MTRARTATRTPAFLPTPLWAWLLLGWLLGRGYSERSMQREADRASLLSSGLEVWDALDLRVNCTLERDPLPPGIPGLRDFRRVRGIGRARAEMLVRHLWESGAGAEFRGEDVVWEEIDGIGPVLGGDLAREFGAPAGIEAGKACRVETRDGVHSVRQPEHDDDSLGTCGSGKPPTWAGP